MGGTIHWLGHDSFRIDGSSTVYIDPWKLPAQAPPADIVLVTHDHYDHFSSKDIAAVAQPGTVLVGPAPVTAGWKGSKGVKVMTIGAGETVGLGSVVVTALPAYNIDKFRAPGQPFHPREAGGLGYIIEMDGRRIYHAGDTDAIPEMRDVACDVALLPIGGTYTMDAAEAAAAACDLMNVGEVIPMHYGDIVGSQVDVDRFVTHCSIPVRVLPLERG